MKYSVLKAERDAAIARALEAERLSMKSEVDRIQREAADEKEQLLKQARQDVEDAYALGFVAGLKQAEKAIGRLVVDVENDQP